MVKVRKASWGRGKRQTKGCWASLEGPEAGDSDGIVALMNALERSPQQSPPIKATQDGG